MQSLDEMAKLMASKVSEKGLPQMTSIGVTATDGEVFSVILIVTPTKKTKKIVTADEFGGFKPRIVH